MRTLKLKLLGLSRACDNNEHMLSEETFRLVRNALDAEQSDPALYTRIAEEKYRVTPMCADCAFPCGRTADPDESILNDAELLSIDLELLERLIRCGLAFYGEKEMNRLLSRAKEQFS